MQYLVTGGCGFIGSHLCDALLADGHGVRILDDLSSGKRENAPQDAELIIGNIRNNEDISRATTGIDGCFHLAAIASVERCNNDWSGSHATNLTGTINLFEASARNNNFPIVYASSAAVYGNPAELPLKETSQTQPLSPYGADKLACELHARAGYEVFGITSVGMRFFNIYGPRQDPSSPYAGVISIFADRIRNGKPITIHGDGLQSRDFVFVADAVAHMRAAMQALHNNRLECDIFNVCTGIPTTLHQLSDQLDTICHTTTEKQLAPPRTGDIRESLGNPEHAVELLGVRATTTLRDGLGALMSNTV